MSLLLDIDPSLARRLAQDMDQHGHAVIEGAVSPEQLVRLRGYVDAQAQRHGKQYFAYHGLDALAGSPLAELAQAAGLERSLARLHQAGAGKAAADSRIFPVLRCVQGGSGRKESNAFHYDATLITLLLPIHIPTQGQQRGDLLLFPNSRGVRANVLLNVIEKALLQNRVARKLLCLAIDRGWLKPQLLPMVPGNAYLFWGYRSLHANQPCAADARRATALFHYADPHAGSGLTRWILRLNQGRARRASARAGKTAHT